MSVKIERGLSVVMALGLLMLTYGVVRGFRDEVIDVGDTAPEFSIVTDGGRAVSRSSFGGRLLVLNFWATWCPPCISEMPSLSRFQEQFASSGVVVLGISVDRSERAYRRLLDKRKVAFLTARDPEARVSASFGTYKYPETYLIDRNGKVVQKIIGAADWSDAAMANQIKALLAS
ncbi:MAG: TlpA family protein disulfide reductase [Acidobacteria bacterium]|nr:TlpA family protein disulfide reductase [Acidobacteriota bacterium]